MTCLLIDNYDSYTFNLFQLIASTTGRQPLVVANDAADLTSPQFLAGFDAVVISPGPGRPQRADDLGHLPSVLGRHPELPVLGVCLGHQAIAYLAGGRVAAAPRPRHGHRTVVRHTGTDLFAGLPQDFRAVRYHSWCVAEPLPSDIEATAFAEDAVIMGLRHRRLPRWGVQFHPESIASEHGAAIVANFFRLAAAHRPPRAVDPVPSIRRPVLPATRWQLADLVVPGAVDTEATFGALFAAAEHAFWLDSSRVEPGGARFSFLGDAAGPLSEVLTYRIADGVVQVRDGAGGHTEPGGIFEVLERRLADRRIADPGLPFDFAGGYVGYFGYELKADLGASVRHVARTPDAAWIFADRLIAVDHEQDLTYLVALHRGDRPTAAAARAWLERTASRLPELRPQPSSVPVTERTVEPIDPTRYLARHPLDYLDDIRAAQRRLVAGESYEICLTNQLHLPFVGNDLAFYRRLRRTNPAPYAALFRVGDVTVFSASPERFLTIGPDRIVESKPIKGTASRSTDPVLDRLLADRLVADAKTRAENLMIVDLLRNDLGRVCEIGSVTVPRFMAVESYATVHQLVSTVRGRLRAGVSAIECVRACFPGGSMTGAPKLRTMAIIDELETEARGIYSGALGFFGTTGAADLSIVIRSAVRCGGELTVGSGGAIVLDSVPDDELAEMLLKTDATLRAVTACG